MRRTLNRFRDGLDRIGATRRASRYDLVLAVIPATFALAVLAGAVLPVDWTAAVAGAGGVSGLAVLDALFLNPPRGPAPGGSTP